MNLKRKMNRIQNCIAHHPLILLSQRIPVQIRMFVSKVRGLTGNWTHNPPPNPYYLPNFMSACCGWDFYSIPEIRPKVTNKIKNQKHLKNKTYLHPQKNPVVLYLNSWRSYIRLFHICMYLYNLHSFSIFEENRLVFILVMKI